MKFPWFRRKDNQKDKLEKLLKELDLKKYIFNVGLSALRTGHISELDALMKYEGLFNAWFDIYLIDSSYPPLDTDAMHKEIKDAWVIGAPMELERILKRMKENLYSLGGQLAEERYNALKIVGEMKIGSKEEVMSAYNEGIAIAEERTRKYREEQRKQELRNSERRFAMGVSSYSSSSGSSSERKSSNQTVIGIKGDGFLLGVASKLGETIIGFGQAGIGFYY